MDTVIMDPPGQGVDLEEKMLTTVDNPYDPFTEFESWFAFDEQSGYHTCGLLGRLALTSVDLSEEENILEINHAIDNILNLFPNMYKVVKRV
jgi:hypothetical protein